MACASSEHGTDLFMAAESVVRWNRGGVGTSSAL
jgi:hypothetical protein